MKTIQEQPLAFWAQPRARLAKLVTRLFLVFAIGLAVIPAPAEEARPQQQARGPQQQARGAIQYGITGHYRVGCWTAIRWLDAEKSSGIASDQAAVMETLDGDGMRAQYQQPPASEEHQFFYAIPGSEAAPLTILSGDQAVLTHRFPEQAKSPSRAPSAIPLGMPWIVSVGDSLGVETIGANEILNREAAVAVSKPRADEFPDAAVGYEGVDLIIISSDGHQILESLNGKQAEAIKHWLLGGGRIFITLGGQTQQLAASAPWIFDLLPLDRDSSTIRSMDPSAIETYTSSQQPLKNFDGLLLPRDRGRILISGRTARRVSTPLAAEYVVGLGRVTVIAADLHDPNFATWPDRLALVTRLIGSLLVPPDDNLMATNRATAFNDLAGQMRATLDQFPLKRKFGFSIVALILMALIAAIGPLDYLLINRVLGRPLLGWLTFPLAAIALSALLMFQSRPASADKSAVDTQSGGTDQLIRCNRMEVVDIDAIDNVGRGFAWSFLYSHPAARFDVSVDPGPPLDGITASDDSMVTAPFGYPGRAFGGIQMEGEDARFPSYRVTMDGGENTRGRLVDLSLAPRSSKSLATRFVFTPQLPAGLLMTRRSGSELLEGSLVNPFPFDLLDGMLIYRNLVYLLPTRFPAGGKIDSVDTLRQKNFRWQLSRQTALKKNKTESEQWDPSRFDRLQRVTEMLLFHTAVGGSRYTFLHDDPLAALDLSSLLVEDRCMLVGGLRESCTDLKLTLKGSQVDPSPISPGGQKHTLIRLIIPVEAKRLTP